RLVASPTVNTKGFSGTWADDGRHYCSMVSKSAQPPAGGEPATLQLTAVGQAPKNVAQVGRMADQAGSGVASCSIERDRAVVADYGSAGNTVQFWVVQLSTGRILWTRSYTGQDVSSFDIRPSRDGQYITEIIYNHSTGKSPTTIYGP